jgi:uncharacterized membrane protein YbaN (DUF454 family)
LIDITEKVKRTLYVLFGTIFLGLGILGIVLPILPTTPFLLLAAACYLRGSEKLHKWLIQHKIFGEFIQNYMEGKGIKRRQKIISIIFLWSTILLSIYYLIESLAITTLLIIIAIAVSTHILRLPEAK